MKYLMIVMILCSSYFAGGCVAKSSHVDGLTKNHYDLIKELVRQFPDNESLRTIERDAYVLAQESSALVDDETIERLVGFFGSMLSKLLGFDISTYLTIGLGLLGVGGTAKVVADKKKKKIEVEGTKKKMKALAELPPEHADKFKDII